MKEMKENINGIMALEAQWLYQNNGSAMALIMA